jgi:hypothetical protein
MPPRAALGKRMQLESFPSTVSVILTGTLRRGSATVRQLYYPDDCRKGARRLMLGETRLGKNLLIFGAAWSILCEHVNQGLKSWWQNWNTEPDEG